MGRRRGSARRMTGVGVALVGLVIALAASAPSFASPGQLDVAFGAGCKRTTDLGGTYDWGYATAVQPDGRILAAGVRPELRQ